MNRLLLLLLLLFDSCPLEECGVRVDFARFGESFNYYIFSVLCSVYLYSVLNIPMDRSNWLCDSAQPKHQPSD